MPQAVVNEISQILNLKCSACAQEGILSLPNNTETIFSYDHVRCFPTVQYSRLNLVVTFWEASHISLKKTFSSFLSLYIVSYTPRGFPICEKKFHRFSFKNLWTSKWKIYFLPQKVVTHFFDFIGFMVVKTRPAKSSEPFWEQELRVEILLPACHTRLKG